MRHRCAGILALGMAAFAARGEVSLSRAERAALGGGHIAVLELRSLVRGQALLGVRTYLTDAIRTRALEACPTCSIITRENIVVLLGAQGKTIEECEGECEL